MITRPIHSVASNNSLMCCTAYITTAGNQAENTPELFAQQVVGSGRNELAEYIRLSNMH